MYIYQAALVIKTGFVLFFIFFFTAGFSQENADSVALQKDSETFLAKKINFSWKGGKLTELLDQLGEEQGLKFAYSEDKIENIGIAAKTFSRTSLSEMLESILKNSEFNYLIIGRTIAIVRDVKAPEKNTPSATNPNSRITQGNESHIYPTSSLSNRLSSEEEKLLRKIYGKELRWKARHSSEPTEKSNDSIEPRRKTYAAIPLIKGKSWFIRANLGLDNYFLRYRNVSPFSWKNDLDFTAKPKRTLFAEAEAGVFYKTFILATGIGFHKLYLENTFKDPKVLASPPGPTPPDIKEKSVTENYSVLTIPLHALIYKKLRTVYFAGGGGVRLNFIKRTSTKGNLKEYYNLRSQTDKFTEKKSAIAYGFSLRAEAGFKATERILLCGGLESTFLVSPYFKNSLYKFYPHSLSFKLSVVYFLH